jgi:hypothetical protein
VMLIIACLQSVKLQFLSSTYDLFPLAANHSPHLAVLNTLTHISLQILRIVTRLRRKVTLGREFSLPFLFLSQKTPVRTPGTPFRERKL